MRFFDTNILLYAISVDPAESAKAEKARSLLKETDCVLSVQVLQEFYVQATRASRPDAIRHEQAGALIEAWLRFRIQENTTSILLAALSARQRYGISYWDAAILEAARSSGCRTVYSEDLSPEQAYDGIHVINPFV